MSQDGTRAYGRAPVHDRRPRPVVGGSQENPEEIREDIARTRAEMGETIDAIEERLRPEQIKAEVRETAPADDRPHRTGRRSRPAARQGDYQPGATVDRTGDGTGPHPGSAMASPPPGERAGAPGAVTAVAFGLGAAAGVLVYAGFVRPRRATSRRRRRTGSVVVGVDRGWRAPQRAVASGAGRAAVARSRQRRGTAGALRRADPAATTC